MNESVDYSPDGGDDGPVDVGSALERLAAEKRRAEDEFRSERRLWLEDMRKLEAEMNLMAAQMKGELNCLQGTYPIPQGDFLGWIEGKGGYSFEKFSSDFPSSQPARGKGNHFFMCPSPAVP